MKKIIALVLAMILAVGGFSMSAFAVEEETALQFGEDGKFTVLHLTDIQDTYMFKEKTRKYINNILSMTNPDLIVLGGDNIAGFGAGFKCGASSAIDNFMSIFEERGIKVAAVFGNHDDEGQATKQDMMAMYEKYDCFVGCTGFTDGERVGNYNLPIRSSDGSHDAFNIWLVDSGTYRNLNDDEGYAAVNKATLDWYTETSIALEEANGGKVPSLMFQHIVVPEIYDALVEVDENTEGAISYQPTEDAEKKYYVLPEGAKGQLLECPCPPLYNEGQFDTVKERGDVLGIVTGHDHTNTFDVEHEGIRLINSPCVGYASYHNEENIGARVFVLDENDPENFETYLINTEDANNFLENEIKPVCDCDCHKDGFSGFLYSIKRIFWKLFRINKTCACGGVHY